MSVEFQYFVLGAAYVLALCLFIKRCGYAEEVEKKQRFHLWSSFLIMALFAWNMLDDWNTGISFWKAALTFLFIIVFARTYYICKKSTSKTTKLKEINL